MHEQIETLIDVVIAQYKLDLADTHGPAHWMRVLHHGMAIADADPEVDRTVVALFALLHDARRLDEGADVHHGKRGAMFALELQEEALIDVTHDQMMLLWMAIHGHSDGNTSDNPTIAACWDADRLDLGRVGVFPHNDYLTSEHARRRDVQHAAWSLSLRGDTVDPGDVAALGNAWRSALSPARSSTARRGRPVSP